MVGNILKDFIKVKRNLYQKKYKIMNINISISFDMKMNKNKIRKKIIKIKRKIQKKKIKIFKLENSQIKLIMKKKSLINFK